MSNDEHFGDETLALGLRFRVRLPRPARHLGRLLRTSCGTRAAVLLAFATAPLPVLALDGSLNQRASLVLPASNGTCTLQARDQATDSYVALIDGSDKQLGTGGGKVVSADQVRPGKQASANKFQSTCGVTNVTIVTDSFLGSGTKTNDPASGVQETELSFSYTGTDGKPYFATAILTANPANGVSQSLSATVTGMLTSFARTAPAASSGSADNATFGLAFATSVKNVDPSDFLTTAGTVSVSGSGSAYLVTVSDIPAASTATLSFAAGQNIQDLNGVGLATPSVTASFERLAAVPSPAPSPPAPAPQPPAPQGDPATTNSSSAGSPPGSPTAQAATLLLADLQGRAAQSNYASRSRQRLGLSAPATPGFAGLEPGLTPLAAMQGWTQSDSDDVWALLADFNQARNRAKLAGLSPDVTGGLDPNFGLEQPGQGLSLYASQGWGAIERSGAAAFSGEASYTTLGLDMALASDFLLGAGLAHEWGRLDFADTSNGWLKKEGWRADAYMAWQLAPGLSLEGSGSYGVFDDRIYSQSALGKTQSFRSQISGRLQGELNGNGLSFRPYAEASYLYEVTQGYADSTGRHVGASFSEMSRSAGGLELRGGPEAALFGLTPYVAIQGEWDWLHGPDIVLASGQSLDLDDWGVSWRAGLEGRLSGLPQGTWLGQTLEQTRLALTFDQAAFGRKQDSLLLNVTLGFDLD